MDIYLRPIVFNKPIDLTEIKGRLLAVYGNRDFPPPLAGTKHPDKGSFINFRNRSKSYMEWIFHFTTSLICNHGLRPVFIFDGEILPSRFKMATHITREMIEKTELLLDLLGIPYIDAPSEGRAQAAHMAKRGDIWAVASNDYAPLLFGTPRLLRFEPIPLNGSAFSKKKMAGCLRFEIIDLNETLSRSEITLNQFVDIAILIGTEFYPGIKGVGPKTALRLIRQYGCLEELPLEFQEHLPMDYNEVRNRFLESEVTSDYAIEYKGIDVRGLYRFLCEERDFPREDVELALRRMEKAKNITYKDDIYP